MSNDNNSGSGDQVNPALQWARDLIPLYRVKTHLQPQEGTQLHNRTPLSVVDELSQAKAAGWTASVQLLNSVLGAQAVLPHAQDIDRAAVAEVAVEAVEGEDRVG